MPPLESRPRLRVQLPPQSSRFLGSDQSGKGPVRFPFGILKMSQGAVQGVEWVESVSYAKSQTAPFVFLMGTCESRSRSTRTTRRLPLPSKRSSTK
jgi:hypothetical protein